VRRHRVLCVYPEAWRDRYGPEIEELLAVSTRPIRDHLNILKFAMAKRLEFVMRKLALPFAGLLAAASLFAMGWTTKDLARGVVEIPFHWWSTIPVIGLVAAGALAFWGRRGERSSRSRNKSKATGS
jgi:hypothetical protein